MSNEFWDEVFLLVKQYDQQRPKIFVENRLYYEKQDGTVIGYYETDHPEGDNYIVLSDPNEFFKNNTTLLRVKNNKLILLDPKQPNKSRLKKSQTGYKTVRGHAALLLEHNETYQDIEYYEQTNN